MVAVLSDDELREQLLEDARQDMEIFRQKYRGLAKLAKVFAAMDEV